MIDGIIKGTGDSRYLKSVSDFLARYPSYADFAAALIAGTLPIDFNGINTEGWQKAGTPLNKANLLSDATAAKFAADTPDTVNAALGLLAENNRDLILSLCKRRCVKVITVFPDGTPVAGIKIAGINPIVGPEVVTDKNGIVFGYATSDTTAVTSDVSSYIDLTSSSSTASTLKDSFTTISLTISPVNYVKVRTSRSVQFSPLLKKLNVTLVGGGGGGGGGRLGNHSGRGGGGGYVTAQTGIAFSADTTYALVVGAGGTGEKVTADIDQFGGAGGTSTFLGLSALGGHTGGMGSDALGNGNGGAESLPTNPVSHGGSQGNNGFGGGGGGGAYATNNNWVVGGLGGSPAGGQGGAASDNACNPGSNGTDGFGGGGGGGGQGGSIYGGMGGTGGSGCVILEMEH